MKKNKILILIEQSPEELKKEKKKCLAELRLARIRYEFFRADELVKRIDEIEKVLNKL